MKKLFITRLEKPWQEWILIMLLIVSWALYIAIIVMRPSVSLILLATATVFFITPITLNAVEAKFPKKKACNREADTV